jgi:hypothetical protein
MAASNDSRVNDESLDYMVVLRKATQPTKIIYESPLLVSQFLDVFMRYGVVNKTLIVVK